MSSVNSPIRLLVADDHQLVRQSIRALLATAEDIQIVGEACDGKQAIELTEELAPDVVLMDIQMPIMNGISATLALAAAGCPTRVLVLSMRGDQEAAVQAARAGAWGYQIKNSSRDDLIAAIRSVHKGIKVASPAVATYFFGGVAPAAR